MKKGDRVRPLENHPLLNLSRRNVGVLVKKWPRYKLNDGTYGQDVEVQFRHKYGTTIFQADELKKVGKR